MDSLREEIRTVITASHPISYFKTEEEQESVNLILDEAKDYIVFSYDEVDGVKWLNEENFKSNKSLRLRIRNQIDGLNTSFSDALSFVRDISQEERVIFLILSADTFLSEENPDSKRNIRFLKNLVNEIKRGDVLLTIFLISDKLVLPSVLEKETLVFEFSYPDRKEIRNMLEKFLEENGLYLSEDLKNSYVSALQGLTKSEIENLLYLALSNDATLDEHDIDLFINYKKQVARKNSIVEYVDLRNVPIEIGGLKRLKEWLKRKEKIFKNLDEAVEKGVDIPKGLLLFGMPGCGKSLTAKYTAKLLNLPLLRLDMGRIMGPYLGQSEENLRRAIQIAESIAPSILWIDELEKAFSGVKGGGSDTLVRIFGTLLTWMQEKTKPVFVIATANDVSGIPPEFMRKGRFDEIFFVDFPDKESIKEIFKIHLKKRGKESSINSIDFDKVLSQMKEGYAGADIEAIVSEVVERAFIEGKDTITTEDIIEVVKIIKPMAETMKNVGELKRKLLEEYAVQLAN